jgi:hypothetical protein
MKKLIAHFFVTLLASSLNAQGVFLNEIRSNDASTDDAEFIEIIGPAGYDVSGWSVTHVNGTGGSEVFVFTFPEGTTIPHDGITDNTGQEVGILVLKRNNHLVPNYDFEWGTSSLQNGPDGLILKDATGKRIQALTWNGLGDLSGGNPAWRNIGSDENDDNSLSAPDEIQESLQASWTYVPPTPGILNGNQSSGDLSLPVQLTAFTAQPGDSKVTLRWITQAEVDHLGFIIERAYVKQGDYIELASYETFDPLKGAGNSSQPRKYTFTDRSVFNDQTYWYCLIDVDINGIRTKHEPIVALPTAASVQIELAEDEGLTIPEKYRLKSNYPNPFNPITHIEFDLPKNEQDLHQVLLVVYNMLGQKVSTLFHGRLAANSYKTTWHGTDSHGRPVPSGIYFYIMKTDNYYAVKKMVLLH